MKTFPGGGILRGRGPGNLVAESNRADPPCCHHTRAWRLQAPVIGPCAVSLVDAYVADALRIGHAYRRSHMTLLVLGVTPFPASGTRRPME